NTLVLPYCWYALVAGIAGLDLDENSVEDYYPAPPNPWNNMEKVRKIVDGIKEILGEYWSCFR
ncbi:MAG: hypothetical protein QW600_03260, partial [Candidatus Bathyarchaeia archaeon]